MWLATGVPATLQPDFGRVPEEGSGPSCVLVKTEDSAALRARIRKARPVRLRGTRSVTDGRLPKARKQFATRT